MLENNNGVSGYYHIRMHGGHGWRFKDVFVLTS